MYNYVFFATPYDYITAAFSEYKNYENVKFLSGRIDSRFKVVLGLSSLYYNHVINHIKLPIDRWLNKYRFRDTFIQKNPIIFVFFAQIARHCNQEGTMYIDHLRKKYPSSVFVWYVVNPIEDSKKQEMECLKKQFDILISFDKQDAEKWGIEFQERYFFSRINLPDGECPKSDVYFLGSQKDRLKVLIPIYDHLTSQGLICDFYLSGPCEDEGNRRPGIHYNTKMSYSENLTHIKGTKCLLEVVQGGQSAPTTRTIESIYYKKKLLTNNSFIEDKNYFTENMYIYDENSFIPKSFILDSYSAVSEDLSEYFNPKVFLDVLAEKVDCFRSKRQ